MNYLQDKKSKNKKIILGLGAAVIVFILIYFKSPVSIALGRVANSIFSPVLALGQNTRGIFGNFGVFFNSQKSLLAENADLKYELEAVAVKIASYESISAENIRLREILGQREEGQNLLLSNILSKPNRSPYDTMVIDAGAEQGVFAGDLVIALGLVPLGRVSEVFSSTSLVVLFSSPGERTEVVVSEKSIFMEAVGRGGGNFEVVLPRDLELPVGTEMMLPGMNSGIVGTVVATLSDPRDALKKVLLVSPVNIQELKFVQIKKN
jgi:cell shape-determining protein MreC